MRRGSSTISSLLRLGIGYSLVKVVRLGCLCDGPESLSAAQPKVV